MQRPTYEVSDKVYLCARLISLHDLTAGVSPEASPRRAKTKSGTLCESDEQLPGAPLGSGDLYRAQRNAAKSRLNARSSDGMPSLQVTHRILYASDEVLSANYFTADTDASAVFPVHT